MVLWFVVRLDLRRLERLPEPGPRLPARSRSARCCRSLLDSAVRRAGVRAHVARRRSSCSSSTMLAHRGPRPAAPAPARARPRDRLVLRPRAERRVGAQGSVLVAGVRHRASARARCSRRGRSSSIEELLGARGRVVDVDAASGCADPARRRDVLAHAAGSRSSGSEPMIVVRAPRPDRAQPRRPAAGPRRRRALSELGLEQAARARDAASRRAPIDARVREPAAARADRPRPRSPRRAGCDGRGRRPADRARLRRLGRPPARRDAAPTRGPAWRADPELRAARRREPRGGRPRASPSFCRDRLGAGDDRVVAVSHVSPIKAAVAWALGVDERRDAGACSSTSRRSPAIGAPARRQRLPRVVQRRRAPRALSRGSTRP